MSLTTTNMGLTSWNLAGDVFNKTQLANNWTAIDAHDHTSTKGVQIPTAGIANGAVTNAKIATNAIQGTNIAAASIGDAALTSPLNAAYKPVGFASGSWMGAAGTFAFTHIGSIYASSDPTHSVIVIIPWVGTDYAVPGMQTKLRMRYTWARNNIAGSSGAINLGLRSISSPAGASGSITWVFGGTVTGSTITFSNLAANTSGNAVTSDFTLADGLYIFSLNSAGVTPLNSYAASFTLTLQVHHTL